MANDLTGTGIWSSGLRFSEERPAREAAKAAEDLGYTAVWLGDIGIGPDLFPRLDALLDATNHLTVATGILNVWMHEVDDVASKYTELTDTYGERLLLGIGVSHGPVIEQFGRGQTYGDPLAKMGTFLDELAATGAVPREHQVLGALRPKMLQLARERTAGACPYLVTPEQTAEARSILGAGKLLAPELSVVLEPDPERARRQARAGLTPYFGLPNFLNQWRRYGFTEDDIAPGGSDRLIDELVGWGDEEAIAARVEEHRTAGADHVCIQVLTGEVVVQEAPYPIEQWRRLAPLVNS
jgi:probable F420-dependent oxidoreductase